MDNIKIILVCYTILYLFFYFSLIMIDDSSYKDPITDVGKYEENVAKILDRAVNLFKRTNLTDLAEKWDKILNIYNSKKIN